MGEFRRVVVMVNIPDSRDEYIGDLEQKVFDVLRDDWELPLTRQRFLYLYEKGLSI